MSHNIDDVDKVNKFISVYNERLNNGEVECYVYKHEQLLGFLLGEYIDDIKCFNVISYYMTEDPLNHTEYLVDFMDSISERVLKSTVDLFRMNTDCDEGDSIRESLIDRGFHEYKRYNMVLDIHKGYNPIELPQGYRFIDFDLNRFFEDREVRMNSYRNHVDGEIFPEIFREYKAIDDDIQDHSISPQIIFNGRLVASSDIQVVSKDVICIDNLLVLDDFQGKGLGKLLIGEVLYRCMIKDYRKCEVTVTEKNNYASEFYKSLGFEVDSAFYFFTKK